MVTMNIRELVGSNDSRNTTQLSRLEYEVQFVVVTQCSASTPSTLCKAGLIREIRAKKTNDSVLTCLAKSNKELASGEDTQTISHNTEISTYSMTKIQTIFTNRLKMVQI